jgi:hypothetical protein
MATQSRATGAIIGLSGMVAAGLVLFFMLRSGMALPFGLKNPFHHTAEEWRAATPEETTAATDIINKQLQAFDQKDMGTVVSLMSVKADPQFQKTTNLGIIGFRMFGRGADYHNPSFTAFRARKATGDLLVSLSVPSGANTKDFEYTLVKEQGGYRILSFHYPNSEFAKPLKTN